MPGEPVTMPESDEAQIRELNRIPEGGQDE